MNIVYPAGTRNNPVDRNAITRVSSYQNNLIAPHALTTRWTYTVPAAKKFQVGSGSVTMYQEAPPAPSGFGSCVIRITPSGGAVTNALGVIFGAGGRAAALMSTLAGLQGLWLEANDVMIGATLDNSTGGTVAYEIDMAGMEFDA